MSLTSLTMRVNSREAVATPKRESLKLEDPFFGLKSQIFLRLWMYWDMKIRVCEVYRGDPFPCRIDFLIVSAVSIMNVGT